MKLILNEEQNYLKETALSFVSEKTPVSHLRQLRDSDDQLRWDKDIWSEMVKLGWSGILIPEEYGGSNFGLTGMSVILQECGKTLTPSPLFATGVLGATAYTGDGSNLTGVASTVADGCIYENSQTISNNYTITTNKNAMSAGPITVASGATLTIPSGSTYTIV